MISSLAVCGAVIFLPLTHAWSWKPLAANTAAPRVSGQAVASSPQTGDVFLFGGLTGAAGSPTTDDLWKFAGGQWSQQHMSSSSSSWPRRRMYGASAIVDKTLYLLGGWDPGAPGSGGEFLDDIWSLDLTTQEWKQLETSLPFPVSRHSACSLGDDKIVLHTYQGVFVFDPSTETVSAQATTGDAPDGLSMCAVCSLGNSNRMLLFGGSAKTQQMSNEAYVLDAASWTWHKLNSGDNDGPTAMASACASALTQDECIICGGAGIAPTGYEGGMGLIPLDDTWHLSIQDDYTASWTKVGSAESPHPEGRVAASLTHLEDGSLLLQGGYDPVSKGTFEEPWILSNA